ncbi:unnamed protein product [Arabis nemorensis]|uniref:Uncharacterized protein n=1 Tax=Arabis nemorensis TaxID=586526 RepID=A0A565CN16_9BRAS|nr:unnamed protein product [Arabis nemorensis]
MAWTCKLQDLISNTSLHCTKYNREQEFALGENSHRPDYLGKFAAAASNDGSSPPWLLRPDLSGSSPPLETSPPSFLFLRCFAFVGKSLFYTSQNLDLESMATSLILALSPWSPVNLSPSSSFSGFHIRSFTPTSPNPPKPLVPPDLSPAPPSWISASSDLDYAPQLCIIRAPCLPLAPKLVSPDLEISSSENPSAIINVLYSPSYASPTTRPNGTVALMVAPVVTSSTKASSTTTKGTQLLVHSYYIFYIIESTLALVCFPYKEIYTPQHSSSMERLISSSMEKPSSFKERPTERYHSPIFSSMECLLQSSTSMAIVLNVRATIDDDVVLGIKKAIISVSTIMCFRICGIVSPYLSQRLLLNKSKAIHGFPLAIQLFAFEVIPDLKQLRPNLEDQSVFTERSIHNLSKIRPIHADKIMDLEKSRNVLVDSILHADDPAPGDSFLWKDDDVDSCVVYVEKLLKDGFEFDDKNWLGGEVSYPSEPNRRMGKKSVREERINESDDDDDFVQPFKRTKGIKTVGDYREKQRTSKIDNDVRGEENVLHGHSSSSHQAPSIIVELRHGLLLQRQHTDNATEGLKTFIEKKISEALTNIMDLFEAPSPIVHHSTRRAKSMVTNRNGPSPSEIRPSTSDTHVHKPNVSVLQPMVDVQQPVDDIHLMKESNKQPPSPSLVAELPDLPILDDETIPLNTDEVPHTSVLNVRTSDEDTDKLLVQKTAGVVTDASCKEAQVEDAYKDMDVGDVHLSSTLNVRTTEDKEAQLQDGLQPRVDVQPPQAVNVSTSAEHKETNLRDGSPGDVRTSAKGKETGDVRVSSPVNVRTSSPDKEAEVEKGYKFIDVFDVRHCSPVDESVEYGSKVPVEDSFKVGSKEESEDKSPTRIIDSVLQNLNCGVLDGGEAVKDVQRQDSRRDFSIRIRIPTAKMHEYIATVQKPKPVPPRSCQYNPFCGMNLDYFYQLNDVLGVEESQES